MVAYSPGMVKIGGASFFGKKTGIREEIDFFPGAEKGIEKYKKIW